MAHPDDPQEVVIVEGVAERLGNGVPAEVVAAYERKYGWRLDPADDEMPFYVLRPHVILAWSSADIRETASRWKLA